MRWPKPPTGSSPFAVWCREFLNTCRQSELKSGVGYNVKQSPSGTTLDILAISGISASSPFQPYLITVLNNADYVTAQLYNWTTMMGNGNNVTIAKAITGRGPALATVDGNNIVYSYQPTSKDNLRSAQIVGVISQWQVMNPRYLADDGSGLVGNIIFACKIKGGTGVSDVNGKPVDLQEFHSRNWCYQWDQSGSLP